MTKKNAAGLKKAERLGIKRYYIAPKQFLNKSDYENELIKILETERIDLICLAGFMRLIGNKLLQKFPNRIMNIHPALLPSFPGLHAQQQALTHGVKITGCTVHFVDAGIDTGPIIAQKAVFVKEGDSEEILSKRILRQEHRLYPKAVQLYFSGCLHLDGKKVIISK